MPENSAERVHYYQGQYLGAQDFCAEQKYHRGMRRRHNLGPHTWGIVAGLMLVQREDEGGPIEVWVEPGMAVDGYGREILVWEPHKVDAALFQSLAADGHYEVWIGYVEEQANQAVGGYAGCREDSQFNRTQEGYRIYVEPRTPLPEGVTVDGRQVKPPAAEAADLVLPPDLSVPYQELPPDPGARWLVRLGSVRWDGTQFAGAADGRLNEERRYAGSVTAELYAPASELHIRDRMTGSTLPAGEDGVAVIVEGSLRVERDVTAEANLHIDGDYLDFRRETPQPDGTTALDDGQFALKRGAVNELRIRIGAEENGDNRLAVGPQTGEAAADFKPTLVVLDNGRVGVASDTPDHPLQVGNSEAPVTMSLRGPDGNTAAATLAFEDDGGTNNRWFKLLYNTQDNLLKIISAEQDPILSVHRTTGNVGIGTDSPAEALEISGSVRGDQQGALRIQTSDGWTDIGAKNESWSHFYTDRPRYYFDKEIRVDSGQIGSYNEDLTLRTAGNTRVTIRKTDGNVGIGKSDPAERLHVMGNILFGADGDLFALGCKQNLRVIAGSVSSAGNVLAGSASGFTAKRSADGGPGIYLIEFKPEFAVPPVVLVSTNDAEGDDQLANARNVTTSGFIVHTTDVEHDSISVDLEDTAFSFIALGEP